MAPRLILTTRFVGAGKGQSSKAEIVVVAASMTVLRYIRRNSFGFGTSGKFCFNSMSHWHLDVESDKWFRRCHNDHVLDGSLEDESVVIGVCEYPGKGDNPSSNITGCERYIPDAVVNSRIPMAVGDYDIRFTVIGTL